jgi:hypothetical protein
MDIVEYLKSLKRRSKSDPIPGTYQDIADLCPVCNSRMILKHACCSNPNNTKECTNGNCMYKINIPNDPV